jgi:hypothetical protein
MTDEALQAQDESRISRRNALKAAVGVGVGAMAWTGPQITAFGATPAYAAACTNFTFKFVITDMNTNSSGSCSTFEYTNGPIVDNAIKDYLGLKNNDVSPYRTSLPNGQFVSCATTETCNDYVFTFPEGDECRVSIRIYFTSQVGNNPPEDASQFWGTSHSVSSDPDNFIGTANGESRMEICFPKFTGANPVPTPPPPNDGSLRWGIWFECFRDGDAACLDQFRPPPPD